MKARLASDRRVRLVLQVLEELQAFEAEDRKHTGNRKGDTTEGSVDTFVRQLVDRYVDHWPDASVRKLVTTIVREAPSDDLKDMIAIAKRERAILARYREECELVHWKGLPMSALPAARAAVAKEVR